MSVGDMRVFKWAKSGSRLSTLVSGERLKGSLWALSGLTVCLHCAWGFVLMDRSQRVDGFVTGLPVAR